MGIDFQVVLRRRSLDIGLRSEIPIVADGFQLYEQLRMREDPPARSIELMQVSPTDPFAGAIVGANPRASHNVRFLIIVGQCDVRMIGELDRRPQAFADVLHALVPPDSL